MSLPDAMWGALYDGLVLSSVLYGIACGQAFRYHSTYTTDATLLKTSVWIVLLIVSVQQCFLVRLVWHYVIPRLNPHVEEYANWSTTGQMILSDMVALSAECFFVSRIWSLSRQKCITILLFLLATCAFGFHMAYIATCMRYPIVAGESRNKWLVGVFTTVRMVTDVGIAISMSLLSQPDKYPEPDERKCNGKNWWIFRAMNCLLATGLLNSIFTVACTILYFVMPLNMVFQGVHFVHGRLYFNSMLASLNDRDPPREYGVVRFITTSDFT